MEIMNDVSAPRGKYRSERLFALFFILACFIASFIYYIYFFKENGYLPSPFINDKSNTFMDYFNVLYWAGQDGRYTEWGSVYPPLNFLLLNLSQIFLNGVGLGAPENIRDEAFVLIYILTFLYLLMPAMLISTKMWDIFNGLELILIYLIIISCIPMLFTFERGNIIILCPVLLAFALSKNNLTRCSFLAIMINIKPYFLILVFVYILKRKWASFLVVMLFSFALFTITGLLTDPYFYLFILNIFNFGNSSELFSLRELLSFPSSISVFSYALQNVDGARFASDFLDFESIDFLVLMIDNFKRFLFVFSISTLVVKRNSLTDIKILTMLVLVIGNLGLSVGGYIVILYICLIPVFMTLRYSKIYLFLMCAIYSPLDFVILKYDNIGDQFSYLANQSVSVVWSLGVGAVIRPAANFLLPLVLAFEFLATPKPTFFANPRTPRS